MNYQLITELFQLVEKFDQDVEAGMYSKDLAGFKRWVSDGETDHIQPNEPVWEGKENGRSPESVISTLIVHMNRYAKMYSKSAIHNSTLTTQEDFIYLINLKAFGAMAKTDLIRKNIQEKPVGMQIINRLINQGLIEQADSKEDKRSKIISISAKGISELERNMDKIRRATEIVTGNLSRSEKMQLIILLQKLEGFHKPIYSKNLDSSQLVDIAYTRFLHQNN